ncbi:MAG TPA: hypothetical protein VK446_07295 [Methylocystis sp.]|nr:hypothetical protein [Methylocystis sp.]
MRRLNLFLLILCSLLGAYYVWSFFVSSRYQALCNITYWFATREQIEACKARKAELDDRR